MCVYVCACVCIHPLLSQQELLSHNEKLSVVEGLWAQGQVIIIEDLRRKHIKISTHKPHERKTSRQALLVRIFSFSNCSSNSVQRWRTAVSGSRRDIALSLASTQPQILENIRTELWSGFDYWSTPFLFLHCSTQSVSKFLGHCHQYRSFSHWVCSTDSTNFQMTVNYSYDTRGNRLLVVSQSEYGKEKKCLLKKPRLRTDKNMIQKSLNLSWAKA